ncbi:MAG: SprT-like domain-containing protein [Acidobacteriota bacterium]
MSHLQALQLELFPVGERAAPQPSVPPVSGPKPEVAAAQPPAAKIEASDPGFGDLQPRLEALLPDRLGSLTLTDNRTSIVSARERRGKLDLRIHRCFAAAPDGVLSSVADFLVSPRRSRMRRDALATIRGHFQQHQPETHQPTRPRRIFLRPKGRVYDLRLLRDAVNADYFEGKLSVHITWGRASNRRRRKGCGFSVRLGTYSERDNVVRIHPCLDDPKVPRYVVEAVVHHEMLHAAIPAVVVGGRRRVHTPEFRRRERQFSHYHKAERWIDRHLARLIGAR